MREQPPPASGRPAPGEYAEYATDDIERVGGDDVVTALENLVPETVALFEEIGESQARGLTYAEGKWTVKEILGHLCDDERIFAYRALSVARGDTAPLAGFDENLYVANASFEERSLSDLIREYRAVRAASVSLFSTFTPDALTRIGEVNGYAASARGLGFHIAGHELHHLEVLRERYLPLLAD